MSDSKPSPSKLDAYAKRIAERHAEVIKAFGEAEYTPAKNKDYLKFLKDMTAEVACRYVMGGVLAAHDETVDPTAVDKKAQELKAEGFTVSGDPKVAAQVQANKTADPEGTKAVPDGDVAFLNSEFMAKSKELGFDPNSDEENFPTSLR